MTQVLLLHSALGLRPAVNALAERLRTAGHHVLAPDLFEGRTFDGGDAGYAEAVAFSQSARDEVQARADVAYAGMSGPRVVLGFSMGCGPAQVFAQERADVQGAILVAGGGLYDGWTPMTWRAGVPLALHHAIDDPWMDGPELTALIHIATRSGSDVSDYVYPGSGHLFFDDGLPEEFDRGHAELLDARLLGFLGRF